MIKILLAIFVAISLISCSSGPKELSKTARTKAAQERINSSKSGADDITRELD